MLWSPSQSRRGTRHRCPRSEEWLGGESGSDLNTEGGSEGATYVGGGVYGGYVVENLRAGGPGEDGHQVPEGDLDVGELSVGEDPLAADGGGLCALEGEGPRDRADRLPLLPRRSGQDRWSTT